MPTKKASGGPSPPKRAPAKSPPRKGASKSLPEQAPEPAGKEMSKSSVGSTASGSQSSLSPSKKASTSTSGPVSPEQSLERNGEPQPRRTSPVKKKVVWKPKKSLIDNIEALKELKEREREWEEENLLVRHLRNRLQKTAASVLKPPKLNLAKQPPEALERLATAALAVQAWWRMCLATTRVLRMRAPLVGAIRSRAADPAALAAAAHAAAADAEAAAAAAAASDNLLVQRLRARAPFVALEARVPPQRAALRLGAFARARLHADAYAAFRAARARLAPALRMAPEHTDFARVFAALVLSALVRRAPARAAHAAHRSAAEALQAAARARVAGVVAAARRRRVRARFQAGFVAHKM